MVEVRGVEPLSSVPTTLINNGYELFTYTAAISVPTLKTKTLYNPLPIVIEHINI